MSQRFHYQEQNSGQTLREGLAEFYADKTDLLAPEELSNEMAEGLRAHDVTHVVFGCDESARGEIVLTRWNLLGSTEGLPVYISGLRSPETRFLFADFFAKLRLRSFLRGIWDGFRALVRATRMRARFPAREAERYLDWPLSRIREEFRIRVI